VVAADVSLTAYQLGDNADARKLEEDGKGNPVVRMLKGHQEKQMAQVNYFTIVLGLLFFICTAALAADPGIIDLKQYRGRPEKQKPSVGVMKKCDDGIPCTNDVIENGECTHTVRPGFCLIDGLVCYTRGQSNPDNSCQECRDDWGPAYSSIWAYDNSHACNDLDECTYQDHCAEGNCVAIDDPDCNGISIHNQ